MLINKWNKKAFSVIEALVGAAIIGMGLVAVSGAINYSTSQYSKLKGSADSILAHTEILKSVTAPHMQVSQIISLCKKIKVYDAQGQLINLLGQNIDDLKNKSNFIKALEVGVGDCGGTSPCLYEIGQRVPPNFDVTVRQIAVENFTTKKDSPLSINTCIYSDNGDLQSNCGLDGTFVSSSFRLHQLDLAIITSREKSNTSTGIGQNAQGEPNFTIEQEAQIYTPLKIPMFIYSQNDNIVACGLNKTLHACKQTTSGKGDGGRLLVKGSLAAPEELTCDLRVVALQALPQLGADVDRYSDHFCISGPLYAMQKAGPNGFYNCNTKVGNIAYNALVCEKGCDDTNLVGEDFATRQMLQWNHGDTGLKIFHCIKCLDPKGNVIRPCDTGLECTPESQRAANNKYLECLRNNLTTIDPTSCGLAADSDDSNALSNCCYMDPGCRRNAQACIRLAGPEVASQAGVSLWRGPCAKNQTGDEEGLCPVTPDQLAKACVGTDVEPVEVGARPADAGPNISSLPCDLLQRCNLGVGGEGLKADSVNYDVPTDFHNYKFTCEYPSDSNSCPMGGSDYLVPAVLLAERVPKEGVLDGAFKNFQNDIDGRNVDGYYYPQAQNWPLYPSNPDMRKKSRYYYTTASSKYSVPPLPANSATPNSVTPFPQGSTATPHLYNSGETSLSAANRRQRSYAYACWADQDSSDRKWKLDRWADRKGRLITDALDKVTIRSGLNYRYNWGDPSFQGNWDWRGNYLTFDGLIVLKYIAKLNVPNTTSKFDWVGPPPQQVQESSRVFALLSYVDSAVRKAWFFAATQELGIWQDVPRPSDFAIKGATDASVNFAEKCGCSCTDRGVNGDCIAYSNSCQIPKTGGMSRLIASPPRVGAPSLGNSVYKDIHYPASLPNPCSRVCTCTGVGDLPATPSREANPWLNDYKNWRDEFARKLATYMRTAYSSSSAQSKDATNNIPSNLFASSNDKEVIKNFWNWFSLVRCDALKYNLPIYRHRFACLKNDISNTKLINGTPNGGPGALECCVKWAQKYDFGDRVDVDSEGNAIYDGDHPTPQHGASAIKSETYFVGPSDPDDCFKPDISE